MVMNHDYEYDHVYDYEYDYDFVGCSNLLSNHNKLGPDQHYCCLLQVG